MLEWDELEEGDIVTFSYDYASRTETPINILLLHVRHDLKWQDVVYDFWRDNGKNPSLANPEGNIVSMQANSVTGMRGPLCKTTPFIYIHIANYWKDIRNRREYFDKLAQENEFDPLIPENWYNIVKHKLILFKVSHNTNNNKGFTFAALQGIGILNYYNGNVAKALTHVYPNIGLEEYMFSADGSKTITYVIHIY